MKHKRGFEFKKRFADGGRIGLKDGMSRRKFMKIMGGIATLPILGKYIKPAMPLIKKGAEITGPALDKIVETVMSAGKLISQSGKRLKELEEKRTAAIDTVMGMTETEPLVQALNKIFKGTNVPLLGGK